MSTPSAPTYIDRILLPIDSITVDASAIVIDPDGFEVITGNNPQDTTASADANLVVRPVAYATMAALRAVTPVVGRAATTQTYAIAGDKGGGYWVARSGSAGAFVHNGGTIIVPSSGTGSDGSLAWEREYSGAIDIRWFGARSDETVTFDSLAAIQGAIDAIGVTVTAITNGNMVSGDVFVPRGRFAISAPIKLYSGVHLYGEGIGSKIQTKAGAGFTGTEMIQLVKTASGLDRVTGATVRDLYCQSNISGMWVVGQNTALVLNNRFTRIYFYCAKGFKLDSYSQKNRLSMVFSFGLLDQLLHLRGNDNHIIDCQKEADSGSSADPYVLVQENGDTSQSANNEFHNVLIEGAGHANKTTYKLEGTRSTRIDGVWHELTASSGYFVHAYGSFDVNITRLGNVLTSARKIKLESSDCVIHTLLATGTDVPWRSLVEVDAASQLRINNLDTRRGDNIYPVLDAANIQVGNHVNFGRLLTPNAAFSVVTSHRDDPGQNLITNPSFEAGLHGWTVGGAGTPSVSEVIASEVNLGLMYHVEWSGGAWQLSQPITITSAMVGLPITFCAKVKSTTGNVQTLASGAGISTVSGYSNIQQVVAGGGWVSMTQTIIPQAAGTLLVGLLSNATSGDIYVDDAACFFGASSSGNPSRHASLDLGFGTSSRTITYGSAAPTTGTWKVGDLRFNTAPAAGGRAGWVCITAGTPGTWAAFGAVDGVSVNAQAGTTYTFVLTDAGKRVTFANASPVAVTVPDDSTSDFPLGTQIEVYAAGDGKVTFAGESSATIEAADDFLSLRVKGSPGTLWKRGANDWVLTGDRVL